MEALIQIPDSSEQLSKILLKASEMFLSIGIRTVTLDDIARDLGISKKTIYSHFKNKGQLVFECVRTDLQIKQQIVAEITQQDFNAIEEMLHIGRQVMHSLQTFSVNIIIDLMKFYPESWQLIEDHKSNFVYNIVLNNIRKGKEQGLYRDNINEDVTARIFIGFTDSVMMPQGVLKNGMPLSELYREHLIHHMYALCTEQGRQSFESLLSTIQLS